MKDILEKLSRGEITVTEAEKQISELMMAAYNTNIKCDICGFHPSVIYTTQFGTFCKDHVRYI